MSSKNAAGNDPVSQTICISADSPGFKVPADGCAVIQIFPPTGYSQILK